MNRKDFIAITAPLFSVLKSAGREDRIDELLHHIKVPFYLNPGDTVGITCPSGFITTEDIQPALIQLKAWGFNVKVGRTVGLRDFTLAGNDEDRTADLQEMLDDKNIKAILFGRGGYGAVRIIDKINFDVFKKHPKWIIGFSDATVFHCHINQKFGIPSIHSKMCNSFPADPSSADLTQINSIDSIKKMLVGEKISYPVKYSEYNRQGTGRGRLVGGNLSIIQNLAGTSSEINTKGKILFIEDTGEYLYSIDRMMWNLLRCGMLENLQGLIIGNFKIKPDDPGEDFGKTLYDIVSEKIKDFNYPVIFDFPVGHVKENYALKCCAMHEIVVDTVSAKFEEI